MRLLLTLIAVLSSCCQGVQAKAAFAHFMLSNTFDFSVAEYQNEIALAQTAHIDAFAVNIAQGDPNNDGALDKIFAAASSRGFKLLFSFDYAGGPNPWGKSEVISLIKKFGQHGGYWRGSDGKPLVSTFEGPASAPDWVGIKAETNCRFIPSYSSLGAKKAVATGVVDGLFSWAGWPSGPNSMDTDVDASYLNFLGDKLYMMPVSPWFYTNMPGFGKNWLWRGDDLWFDRWGETWFLQPDYVQIISWNDFGESHYIGPLNSKQYGAFAPDRGNSPFNYALDMPHDGWRLFLPFAIDMYKQGTATITREGVVAWYKKNPGSACGTGGTTGNTASQQQTEYAPALVSQDRIYYDALLGSSATVTVSIGGVTQTGTWGRVPNGNIGIYHGSVPFNGATGTVVVTISRGSTVIARMTGTAITTSCTNGLTNWNAWVGSATSASTISAKPSLPISQQVCVFGTGKENSKGLCEFTCRYGYCPLGSCTCRAMGAKATEPTIVNVEGFPKAGASCIYEGLCSYACNHGYCPTTACSTDPADKGKCVIPPPDDEPPPTTCVKGTGSGNMLGLCDFSCYFGFCPEPCTCTARGTQNTPPAYNGRPGYPALGVGSEYLELCNYA